MNERIRELWTQCVIKHTKTPMNWQDVADEFAEMIVNECADMVAGASLPDAYSEPCLSIIADEMREHFGFEE